MVPANGRGRVPAKRPAEERRLGMEKETTAPGGFVISVPPAVACLGGFVVALISRAWSRRIRICEGARPGLPADGLSLPRVTVVAGPSVCIVPNFLQDANQFGAHILDKADLGLGYVLAMDAGGGDCV